MMEVERDASDGTITENEGDSLEAHIVDIAMSGRLADIGKQAIAAAVAKGLPITFQRDENVIKQYPDGREEVLAMISRTPFKVPDGVAIIGKP